MSVCTSITKQVLPKRARTPGALRQDAARKWRPEGRLTTCEYAPQAAKEQRARLRTATAASARAAHQCGGGPAPWRGATGWAAPHTGAPAGAWRRGCGKPWGAQSLFYTMPCHSLTERSQSMLTAPQASILLLSSLFPLSMNNTQPLVTCLLVHLSATSPNPKRVPPHPFKQHMPCTPQVPPPAALAQH